MFITVAVNSHEIVIVVTEDLFGAFFKIAAVCNYVKCRYSVVVFADMHASRIIAARNALKSIALTIVVIDPEVPVHEILVFLCKVLMYDVHSRYAEFSSIVILADRFRHVLIAGCFYRVIASISISCTVTECELI